MPVRRAPSSARISTNGRVSGPALDYQPAYLLDVFSDPDCNGWLLQEVTTRLPARARRRSDGILICASDLSRSVLGVQAAHGEHEKRTGQRGADRSDIHAAYMAADQAGEGPHQH